MMRRTAVLALEILAGIGAGLVILVFLAIWRLSYGPLGVDVLIPYIERALSDRPRGVATHIGRAVLTWQGNQRAFTFHALNVRAASGARLLAEVPEIDVGLSAAALVRGIAAPTRLEIFGAHIKLIHGASGFGLSVGPQEAAGAELAADLAASLLAPPDRHRNTGYLREIRVDRAEVTMEDRVNGLAWRAPDCALTLYRTRSGFEVQAGMTLDQGGQGAHILARALYLLGTGKIDGTVELAGVQPAMFAPVLPALAMVRVPFAGRIQGRADLVSGPEQVTFDLAGGGGKLASPQAGGFSVAVTRMGLKGSLQDHLKTLRLSALSADFGGPQLTIQGSAAGLGGETEWALEAALRDLPVARFAALWPPTVSVHARDWVTANMTGGMLQEAHLALTAKIPADFSAIDLRSVTGGLSLLGTKIAFMKDLPPVTDVAGLGRFDKNQLVIALKEGRVGDIRITGGTVNLHELGTDRDAATVEVTTDSTVADALALIDHPPLRYAQAAGLVPASMGGTGTVRLKLDFPLINDLPAARIKIDAEAALHHVAMPRLMDRFDLTEGELKLTLDNDSLDLAGDARLNGVPAQVGWRRNFAARAPLLERYTVHARLDDAARRAVRLDLSPYVAGPFIGTLEADRHPGGVTDMTVTADLGPAQLQLADLGWTKPAGVAATASARLAMVGGILRAIPEFGLAGTAIDLHGHATLAPFDAVFDRARFGFTDMAGRFRERQGGGYDAEFHGPAFDAEALLDTSQIGRPDQAHKPTLALNFGFDQVRLGDGRLLHQVTGKLLRENDRFHDMAIDARLDRDKSLSLRILPQGNIRTVTVRANDGGLALKDFDILHIVHGGQLAIDATIDDRLPRHPMSGKALLKDYTVRNAPALAKILAAIWPPGVIDLMRGEGIVFDDFTGPFTLTEGVIEVHQAAATGSSLGLTMEGKIDLGRGTLDVAGAIAPMYAINSALSNIPVLGTIISGGPGQGILAANYGMRGPLADPSTMVNPLSVLTPGILRNVFGIFTPAKSP